MSYRSHISLAAAAAIVIHLFLALLFALWGAGDAALARGPQSEEMMVVDLMPELPREPPAREQPRRLADQGAPSSAPPGDTDRIAEQDLLSQDMTEGAGDAPQAERTGPADSIGRNPSPPPPAPQPEPQPSASPGEVDEGDSEAQQTESAGKSLAASGDADSAAQTEAPAQEPPPEPAQEQQAEPTPTPEAPETRVDESRPGTGVKTRGVLSFAAKRSELAPYLRSIQKQVERQWQAKVLVRYRGPGPARAVVHCAITPAGELETVEILEAGASLTFGEICRDAIRDAAPFGPFPFEAPELLRNKNLEITWTFRYN